ncbi:hypothetical protein Glove_185g49 [Diversispora epigaea]|uniref:Protein kinase domain-containing protein n=1 Tax=Diversispora epigaea TaxID=1348612 RepID=A0A397IWU3_9GLOM|nr:hypothetical protein Glove_185g49 [Diversispora epigaea]
MYTKERSIKKVETWSNGNAKIDKIIQESQIQWIPYDDIYATKYIIDSEYYTFHLARLRNYMIDEREYRGVVALKELKDNRNDILEFIKEIKNNSSYSYCFAKFFGISKNPFTKNYIIVMESCRNTSHNCLSDIFRNVKWHSKIYSLQEIIRGLNALHRNNLIHCDLHSRNILIIDREKFELTVNIDPDLCKLANDLILNPDNKNNNVYGSIPYLPPEVLRGNAFTKKGDIYSFGGIMYEAATGNQPFSDQAHDTYLMIDICNGVRPKVPDMMLNFIPKCYLDTMYQCWDDDPSKRPTTDELSDIIYLWKSSNIYEEFKYVESNKKRMNKSHKKKLLRSFYNFHPQSCYISRNIYTLYELKNSLEDIKSGKCADPNLYTCGMESSK